MKWHVIVNVTRSMRETICFNYYSVGWFVFVAIIIIVKRNKGKYFSDSANYCHQLPYYMYIVLSIIEGDVCFQFNTYNTIRFNALVTLVVSPYLEFGKLFIIFIDINWRYHISSFAFDMRYNKIHSTFFSLLLINGRKFSLYYDLWFVEC